MEERSPFDLFKCPEELREIVFEHDEDGMITSPPDFDLIVECNLHKMRKEGTNE